MMNTAIDFRSDTVTRPSSGMRQAMAGAPVGDDVYGDDPTVNDLEEKAAQLLGQEAGLFVTSGTQGNLLAILTHCQRGEEYIAGTKAHAYLEEGGGGAVLASVQPHPVENQTDGTLDLASVRAAIKPDDFHLAITRLFALKIRFSVPHCRWNTLLRRRVWQPSMDCGFISTAPEFLMLLYVPASHPAQLAACSTRYLRVYPKDSARQLEAY